MKLHKLEPTEKALLDQQKTEEYELSIVSEYQRQAQQRKQQLSESKHLSETGTGAGPGAFKTGVSSPPKPRATTVRRRCTACCVLPRALAVCV